MLTILSIELWVLILAIFIGFEVISKVPTMLHTPLMSGSNAISGIILIGAIIVAANPQLAGFRWFAYGAIVFATINVIGGFVVTDRMLGMFKTAKGKQK